MTFVAALVVLVQGAETPDYKHWASCKPGSWVRSRIEQITPDFTLTQVVTVRLLRVEKDAAFVEVVQRVYSGDQLVSAKAMERGIPARVDADLGVVKETDETIEIAGRKLACRRADIQREIDGEPYSLSFWISPEVPGGTVKSRGGPRKEKEPATRMLALEWRKETAAGVDEVSTRLEAEAALKKMEDALSGAKTLRFSYEQIFRGTKTRGSFTREGDRLYFSWTQPREREGPLSHTRVSDGKDFVLLINGKRIPETHKTRPGLGGKALDVILYASPTSLDPWWAVEEGASPREKSERSDLRVRSREKLGGRETIVLEFLTGKAGSGHHLTLWIDAERSIPLKRFLDPADGDLAFGRLEDSYSDFVLDGPVDAATFVAPKD